MTDTEKYDDVQVATQVEDSARRHEVDSKEDSQRSDDAEILSTTSKGRLVEGYIAYWPIIQFGFTLLATWECVGLTLQLNLQNGGASTLVYGTIFSGVGSCLVALSIAEMASMDPAQGWVTVFGWMTGAAANLVYLAQGVLAVAVLWHPELKPTAWQTALVMCVFVVPPVVGNLWFRRIVAPLE
ncbi:hypothetical protein PG994_008516 [Apiospora phragmitis]|uniref:Uncharacterized protein n=1 Tax=Apiospora phragmitis TaxID=2905665 RepID=A0ABR1UJL1_9PEZI